MNRPVLFLTLSLCTLLCLAPVCRANVIEAELNANQSAIEGRFGMSGELEKGILSGGTGAIYDDDDYTLYYGYLALGNEILYRGLICSLGFKGFTGDVEKNEIEDDVGAVGFLARIYYEIPMQSSSLRFFLDTAACAAPRPLTFMDTERFLEMKAEAGVYVLQNAAIFGGYRYLRIRFDDQADLEKMEKEALYVGYRMSF